MRLREIKEGEAKLLVPDVAKPELGEVFYNPAMAFDRDISIAFLGTVRPKRVCDALAATGVRGIRYAKETSAHEVYINDANPKAFELIKKNLKLNELDREVVVTNEDANVLLRKERFDFVDIDPFGSPAPFLDSAAKAFKKSGWLAVTATDTAPLCGTCPATAWRRYGVRSIRTDYYKELGTRILITFIIKALALHEKAFIPLLSYCRLHYLRIFGLVQKSVARINKISRKFGFLYHCFKCGWRNAVYGDNYSPHPCPICKSKTNSCGEIYLGKISDRMFCKRMLLMLTDHKERGLISTIADELDVPFYFDLHYLCKMLKKGHVPKLSAVIEKLEKSRFAASRTIFCKTGIKSNCDFEKMKTAL